MNSESKSHAPHIVPLTTYLAIGSALFVLTAITVWVAHIPLGGWNVVVALFIAGIKATLVALVFMHLLYDKKMYLVIFVSAIVILSIFIMLTMFDVNERGTINAAEAGPINSQSDMYKGRVVDTLAAEHGEAAEAHQPDSVKAVAKPDSSKK
jgi:cytochrome c oxidase subunit IV